MGEKVEPKFLIFSGSTLSHFPSVAETHKVELGSGSDNFVAQCRCCILIDGG